MNKSQLLDERFALAYRADFSSRYHRRRASFLSNLDTLSNLVSIIAGTSVFVSLMKDGPVLLPQIAGLIISGLAICQVVFGFGLLSARHAEWMRAWDRLANEIRATPNPSENDLRKWHELRAEIEGECVNEFRALAHDCENQARSHLGTKEGIVQIGRLQRAFIHLGTFQGDFPEITNAIQPLSRKDVVNEEFTE